MPYKRHEDKIKNDRKWHSRNKERISEYNRKYREEHKDDIKVKRNTEEHKEYMRKYKKQDDVYKEDGFFM